MFQFSFKDIETYYRISVVWQEGKQAIPPTFWIYPIRIFGTICIDNLTSRSVMNIPRVFNEKRLNNNGYSWHQFEQETSNKGKSKFPVYQFEKSIPPKCKPTCNELSDWWRLRWISFQLQTTVQIQVAVPIN